jgi:molybdopterin converting factor small subunit
MPERTIRVQYYALLREQAGRSDESLITAARDARELYAELSQRYAFTLPLKCCGWRSTRTWRAVAAAKAGDAVVFFPPGWRMNAFRFSTAPLDTASLQREMRDVTCGFALSKAARNHNEGLVVTRLNTKLCRTRREKARIVRKHGAVRRHARRLCASRGLAGSARWRCGSA